MFGGTVAKEIRYDHLQTKRMWKIFWRDGRSFAWRRNIQPPSFFCGSPLLTFRSHVRVDSQSRLTIYLRWAMDRARHGRYGGTMAMILHHLT